jgi:PAS domain S-box-containing protein
LQFVLQGSQLGFWDWNIATGEVKRNNQWALLLGYEGETTPNMEQWFELVHSNDRDAAQQSIQDHLQQRTPTHKCTYRIRAKNGQYRWTLDHARVVAWDSSGQAMRMSGTLKDIHERKMAEEALRQSDERFKYAMDATQDGLWDWDMTTNEMYFSPGYYRMLGYELDAFPMTRDEWGKRAHPEDLERTRRAVDDCKENRARNVEVEFRLLAANGEWRTILSRGRVVKRDAQGNALRMVGTQADITERKKLEEQLLQSQKLEAIGTLAGGIAHEFSNILAGMITLTEIVKMDMPAENQVTDDLDNILKLGLRGRDIVRQILSYSRKNKIEHKPIELETIFKDTVGLLRVSISPNIEIRESLDADTGRVVGDATQVQQVIMNLANNAVQAMKSSGGVLELRTEPTVLNAEQVRTLPGLSPGKYVRISVCDTGIGMDEATIARIFDPFFTTKPIGEGTGLGLSVAQGIIKSHRGSISVSSVKDAGTTFTILLPRIDVGNDHEPPQKPLPGGAERLSLVNDEDLSVLPIAKSVETPDHPTTGTTTKRFMHENEDPRRVNH